MKNKNLKEVLQNLNNINSNIMNNDSTILINKLNEAIKQAEGGLDENKINNILEATKNINKHFSNIWCEVAKQTSEIRDNVYSNIPTNLKKYKLIIEREDDIYYDFDPREWDNITTMICWHDRYTLGDKHNFRDEFDFLEDLASRVDSYRTDRILQGYEEDFIDGKQLYNSLMKVINREYVILPLYAYEHGDITISTNKFSCSWDSGQIGYIYMNLKDGNSNNEEENKNYCLDILEKDVEVYDNYLQGEIYSYRIEEYYNGEHTGTYDQCGGFYGSNIFKNGIADNIPQELNIELHSKFCWAYEDDEEY